MFPDVCSEVFVVGRGIFSVSKHGQIHLKILGFVFATRDESHWGRGHGGAEGGGRGRPGRGGEGMTTASQEHTRETRCMHCHFPLSRYPYERKCVEKNTSFGIKNEGTHKELFER